MMLLYGRRTWSLLQHHDFLAKGASAPEDRAVPDKRKRHRRQAQHHDAEQRARPAHPEPLVQRRRREGQADGHQRPRRAGCRLRRGRVLPVRVAQVVDHGHEDHGRAAAE